VPPFLNHCNPNHHLYEIYRYLATGGGYKQGAMSISSENGKKFLNYPEPKAGYVYVALGSYFETM
jgi:hypothetical protein